MWLGDKLIREGIKGPNMDRIWVVKNREAGGLLSAMVREVTREGRMNLESDRAEIG